MRIALDYDGTYTADPELWNAFIETAIARGHEVICVTMRYSTQGIQMPCEIIYTDYQAKIAHTKDRGLHFDIWIDDMPHFLFEHQT